MRWLYSDLLFVTPASSRLLRRHPAGRHARTNAECDGAATRFVTPASSRLLRRHPAGACDDGTRCRCYARMKREAGWQYGKFETEPRI
jgi:hypothetical protein